MELILGDCLEKMKDISDQSIDMILCDLPYGCTVCKWDTVIPFEPLWDHYNRIIKTNGAIVLFGSQPFTSALIMSNPKMFRYEWIWDKVKPTGVLNASHRPLKRHENILVFSQSKTIYNPQKTQNPKGVEKRSFYEDKRENIGGKTVGKTKKAAPSSQYEADKLLPVSIQQFSKDNKPLHPTQKPVALCEYLIKTYTNKNDVILDNCMGSGTTAIACLNTNRQFIGIEKDYNYFEIAKKRIDNHKLFTLNVV